MSMPETGLVILAAGSSTRLGSPKQLLRFNGRGLLQHAAETALASICRPVLVVLGSSAEKLEPELSGLSVIVARNADWASGMGSSIRVGMQQLLLQTSERLDAVVFMVCDQPLVRAEDIDHLCSTHSKIGRGIISSLYANSRGVPVLFHRRYFSELASLASEQGAKRIIEQNLEDNYSVPLPAGIFDVDTYEDYRQIIDPEKNPP